MSAPTDKQIAFIADLCGDKYGAYHQIAKDMGCSPSAARRRATKRDASRTIDRLKG